VIRFSPLFSIKFHSSNNATNEQKKQTNKQTNKQYTQHKKDVNVGNLTVLTRLDPPCSVICAPSATTTALSHGIGFADNAAAAATAAAAADDDDGGGGGGTVRGH
jgi:hypothetical protein